MARRSTEPRPLELTGSLSHRLRSLLSLLWACCFIPIRRLVRGPLWPGWPLVLELTNHFFKVQTRIAFDLGAPAASRAYGDALHFNAPVLAEVTIEPATASGFRGHWFRPREVEENTTLLYLHGGGYAFYGKAYASLIAYVARAAKAPAFALDYRLIPEHPYPAQLEDALAAYRWLLERAGDSRRLVVAGDSAGGHLALTLLLKLRELKLPMPLLAIGLGPWVDLRNGGESMILHSRYDWIEKRMADGWARWLCPGADLGDPSLSPAEADLRELPPLYLQAGSAEVLFDQIRGFAERARSRGAEVRLDV